MHGCINMYLIRMYSESEKKYYYLSKQYDKAIEQVFGCCYVWGKRTQARTYKTKTDAQHEIRKMIWHGTGHNAEVYQVKRRTK